MTEIWLIYAIVAGVLFGMGVVAGPFLGVPISMVILIALTWPALAVYSLAMLVSGYVAGFCIGLWKLIRGEQP